MSRGRRGWLGGSLFETAVPPGDDVIGIGIDHSDFAARSKITGLSSLTSSQSAADPTVNSATRPCWCPLASRAEPVKPE
jgi:hypothetical protein